MKRGPQVNRVPVHDISLNPPEESDTVAHSEEVHKTHSIKQCTTKYLISQILHFILGREMRSLY